MKTREKNEQFLLLQKSPMQSPIINIIPLGKGRKKDGKELNYLRSLLALFFFINGGLTYTYSLILFSFLV